MILALHARDTGIAEEESPSADIANITTQLCKKYVTEQAQLLIRAKRMMSAGGNLSNEDHAAVMTMYAREHSAAPQATKQERLAIEKPSSDVYPGTRLSALDAHTHLLRYIAKQPDPLASDKRTVSEMQELYTKLEGQLVRASKDPKELTEEEQEQDEPVLSAEQRLDLVNDLKYELANLRRQMVLRKAAPVFEPRPTDADDLAQFRNFDNAMRALCLKLCMDSGLFAVTKTLSNLLEWRHLFQMVFEVANNPSTPENPISMNLSDDQERKLRAGENKIPGYKRDQPLTFATLRWLERALETRRMLHDAALVQALFNDGHTLARSLELASRPEVLERAKQTLETAIQTGNDNIFLATYCRALGYARRVKALWMAEQFGVVERESKNEMALLTALTKPKEAAPANPFAGLHRALTIVAHNNGLEPPSYIDDMQQ